MIKEIKIFFLPIFFCFLASFSFSTSTKADNLNDAFRNGNSLDNVAGTAGYQTGSGVDIYQNISSIINFSLSFLGVIFIILMIYAGWLWMTAQGEEAQVEKAKRIVIAAIIGVVLVVSSYAISWFVINALSQKTIAGA